MVTHKKLYLEFVRGVASIIVVLYHYNELYAENFSKQLLFTAWGADAVMIFFILSGCVINISQTRKPKSKSQFFLNRFLRLYPQFTIGFLLGLLVIAVLKMPMPSLGKMLGNIFMLSTLQGYIVKCITTNSPIWSLSFEMFFYLMFLIAIGPNQKKIMPWLLFLSLATYPFYYYISDKNMVAHFVAMMSYFSIWIVGYYIYEYRNLFSVDVYAALLSVGLLPLVSRIQISSLYYGPIKYLVFAMVAIPFFRYCLQHKSDGRKIVLIHMLPLYGLIVVLLFLKSDSMFVSKIVYSAFPLGLILLLFFINKLGFAKGLINVTNRLGAIIGKYSYALYITHYPVQFLFAHIFKNPFFFVIISLPLIILTAYWLEYYFQPLMVKYLKFS